jgi:hypothetical protein
VADEEENAGNHIGSPKALVRTDIAQVTATLMAATQRWQQYLAAKYPKTGFPQGSAALPQATEVEEAKQAAGDPIGDEAAIARAEATAMNAAAANGASAKAAAAQAEEKMKNVMENTKPVVPPGSPAKEVQPESQLEPTAKENIPAVTVADNSANDGADIKITEQRGDHRRRRGH